VDELAWRSPLEHRRGAGGAIELRAASVRVAAGPRAAAFVVRGDAAQPAFADAFRGAAGVALPNEPNRCAGTDPRALWLAPDAWLIVTAAGVAAEGLASRLHLARPPIAQVVDLGDGQACIEVTGRRATELLAGGCELDLDPARFGQGRCARTLLARIPVLIDVHEPGVAYHVYVDASLADHLWRWFAHTVREFAD